jgi:nicotinamidase-related amidase
MADLSLPAASTALVLIDLQNAIVSRDPRPHSAADVVAKTKQLADAFRAAGSPVIFVHVDINHFLKFPVDESMPLPPEGVPAAAMEIVPGAGKQPGDLLITKRHWGAFAGTDLEQELRSRGVDTVVLCGIATNMGVESTLRQGTGLGFAFVVAEDACSSTSAEAHEWAFKNIFPRLSRVRSTAEVVAAIG